jgi:hypothetical protein
LRRILALAALLSLAACGPALRWQHPSLSDAEAGAEYADCGRQAWSEAQSRAWMNRWSRPSYLRGRDGRLYAYDPWSARPSFNDTWFDEMRLRDFCLRNKGFRLVPVPQ